MKIIYSTNFLRKSRIPNYPITGYWYQLGLNGVPSESQTWLDLYKESYSNFYPCNTLIKELDGELKCEVSFVISEKDRPNPNKVIYVIALDNLSYSKIEDLIATNDPEKYFSQVAAIIILDNNSKFDYYNTNIIDLKYVPTCSFSIVNSGHEQVTHYQSEVIDRANFYQSEENQFIDKSSGIDKMREYMSTQVDLELNGKMTIKKTGAIQL